MLFLQALVFTSTLWLPECQCSKPLFLDDPHVTHTVENKRGPELSCAKPPCKAQSAFQGILQCWVSDHFNQGIPMRNGEWVDYLMVVPSAFLQYLINSSPLSPSACMHAQSLQSCLTLSGPMNCSPPGYSVHGYSPDKNTVGCHDFL